MELAQSEQVKVYHKMKSIDEHIFHFEAQINIVNGIYLFLVTNKGKKITA